jgi:hypothetical protein
MFAKKTRISGIAMQTSGFGVCGSYFGSPFRIRGWGLVGGVPQEELPNPKVVPGR